jgi:hypothetical protein
MEGLRRLCYGSIQNPTPEKPPWQICELGPKVTQPSDVPIKKQAMALSGKLAKYSTDHLVLLQQHRVAAAIAAVQCSIGHQNDQLFYRPFARNLGVINPITNPYLSLGTVPEQNTIRLKVHHA